jgi:uncharacterized LabA/DUF88 family protein
MIKRPEQRVAIFIDTQNLYHSAKHLYGARLHFGKLVETLTEGRHLIRAFAYVAKSKTGEEKGFLDALVAAGIELRIKDVIEFSSGERKADWDVGMAIDAVKFSDRVDVVVLVTGDGDFVPLVEYLQSKGIIVIVAAFAESTSGLLREACDEYFDISEHKKTLLMKSGILHSFRAPRLNPTAAATSTVAARPAIGRKDPEEEPIEEDEELEGRIRVTTTRTPTTGAARGRGRKVRITT